MLHIASSSKIRMHLSLLVCLLFMFCLLFALQQHIWSAIADTNTVATDAPTVVDRDNVGAGNVLRIVERDSWLAQPPSHRLVELNWPVPHVIVLPTQTQDCTTQAACTFRVRFIQTFNIESLEKDDIIYNFLIGGDGYMYEGRGWKHKGAHLKGYNDDSVSFAYIGTFKAQQPTSKQLNVTKLLLEEGIRVGAIASNYKLLSAHMLDPTPVTSGQGLYECFKDWPHWST